MLRPEEVLSLMERSWVSTQTMPEIDRVMTPILAELVTLKPGNNDHPVLEQLFDWLVDPQRSGEEFLYVTQTLYQNVSDIMDKQFIQYVPDEPWYLGKIAAEALAARCPVLEGPWELSAWNLVYEISSYPSDEYGAASNRLTSWLIQIIGDPEPCPNPYLRIELISVLYEMVESVDNIVGALEAVLSACSSLNADYLMKDDLQNFHRVDLYIITETMKMIGDDKCMMDFDDKLSDKLQSIKSLRLSAIINNGAYNYMMLPNRTAEPIVLYGLEAILETIIGSAKFYLNNYYYGDGICPEINELTVEVCNFIKPFKKSCQTPQLVDLTASCIMGMLENVILLHTDKGLYDNLDPQNLEALFNIDELLQELISANHSHRIVPLSIHEEMVGVHPNVTSPLYLKLINKFEERLKELKHLSWLFVRENMLNICHLIKG